MEQTAFYGWFAERYGWTEQQVDSQHDWYIQRLPAFADIVDEVRAEKSKPK